MVTHASASISNRNASNSSSARSTSSISSTAGRGPGWSIAASSGRAQQVVGAEQVLVAEHVAARLGQPDAEQLPRIVPLVERLGGGEPLVALQPDQRRVQHGGQRLGRLGLADPGLALQQDRLAHPHGQEQRRRSGSVGEVAGRGQRRRERRRRAAGRSARRSESGHPCVRYRCGSSVKAACSRSRRNSTSARRARPASASGDDGHGHAADRVESRCVPISAGSAGRSRVAAAVTGARLGAGAMISARIETATSDAVRAPMSRPGRRVHALRDRDADARRARRRRACGSRPARCRARRPERAPRAPPPRLARATRPRRPPRPAAIGRRSRRPATRS